jgi:hypothetical protein
VRLGNSLRIRYGYAWPCKAGSIMDGEHGVADVSVMIMRGLAQSRIPVNVSNNPQQYGR